MADAKKKAITIQGLTFEVSQPYAAGHVVTEMEAMALNQTRAENIRNNFAKTVKDAQAEDGSVTDDQKKALAKELAEYDKQYEFSVGGGRSLDPIQKEAKIIATQLVDAKIAKSGTTISKYKEANKEKYDTLIAQVMEKDEIQKKAVSIVKEREALADSINI
jgi:hypothetical protein